LLQTRAAKVGNQYPGVHQPGSEELAWRVEQIVPLPILMPAVSVVSGSGVIELVASLLLIVPATAPDVKAKRLPPGTNRLLRRAARYLRKYDPRGGGCREPPMEGNVEARPALNATTTAIVNRMILRMMSYLIAAAAILASS